MIKDNDVKLLLLCNPHNPGGRVWPKDDLLKLKDLVLKYHVMVAEDQIHCDLVFDDYTCTSFLGLDPALAKQCITLTAGTKTFNMAGVKLSFMLIPDPKLNQRVRAYQEAHHTNEPNTFGIVASQAAFTSGEPWRKSVMTYLQHNRDLVFAAFNADDTRIVPMLPEATYLIWLDFHRYGLTDEALADKLRTQANVYLNSGYTYGPGGQQFMRLNFAIPKEELLKAIKHIKTCFD